MDEDQYRDIEPLANLKIGKAIDRLSKENAERTSKINADFATRGLGQSGPLDAARLKSRLRMAEEVCREVSSIWLHLILKRDQVLTQEATSLIMAKVQAQADGFSRQGIESSMRPTPQGVTGFLDAELARGIQGIVADIRRDLEIRRREQALAPPKRENISEEAFVIMGANEDLRTQ